MAHNRILIALNQRHNKNLAYDLSKINDEEQPGKILSEHLQPIPNDQHNKNYSKASLSAVSLDSCLANDVNGYCVFVFKDILRSINEIEYRRWVCCFDSSLIKEAGLMINPPTLVKTINKDLKNFNTELWSNAHLNILSVTYPSKHSKTPETAVKKRPNINQLTKLADLINTASSAHYIHNSSDPCIPRHPEKLNECKNHLIPTCPCVNAYKSAQQ